MNPPIPKCDPGNVRIYCDVVFSGLNGFVPIRFIAEKGVPGSKPSTPFVSPQDAADTLIARSDQEALRGRGAFVVPGTVAEPGRARAGDVVQSAVVLVDLDAGNISEKLAHLEAHLGEATLVVGSGGRTIEGEAKIHAYWRLAQPADGADLQRLAKLRALIESRVGGDPSFDSLHQPIRVAGSVHGKHGVLSEVKILAHRDQTYDLSELEVRVENMPAFAGIGFAIDTGRSHATKTSAVGLFTKTIRAGAIDEVTRHDAVGKVIGHWLYMVRSSRISLGDAWERVRGHNAACIIPPWDEGKLAASFASLQAKDIEQYGPLPDNTVVSQSHAGLGPFPTLTNDQLDPGQKPVSCSEDDLAHRFAERFHNHFRFAPSRGGWMRWSGSVWQPDNLNQVRDCIRHTCRAVALQVQDKKAAARISSERTMMSVERLSRTDPIFVTAEQTWDVGPMVINTPKGILDLETGSLARHEPSHRHTRLAGASPEGECPIWRRFIAEITDGSPELISYLQRLCGYCLTGSMIEQVYFFFCGTGANGKSVFLAVLEHLLGDYAATAALDTFTAGTGDRHPTDLAGIAKARVAIVSETEHGKAWAESRIKAITGGDRLRVRFLHRDFFEIDPTFKIIVAGNSRPRLRGVGEAMRRRLHLIPFDVTIPPEKRDKDLVSKLKMEKDGIINWMLDGCRAWQQIGLSPPAIVQKAANAYFEDEDLIGQWIDDACQLSSAHWARSSDLYASWKTWSENRGIEAGSQRSFGEELRTRGFSSMRTPRIRGWSGIALRSGNDLP